MAGQMHLKNYGTCPHLSAASDSYSQQEEREMIVEEFTLPESPKPFQTPQQIQEIIRRRAYELFEKRGKEAGHDLDDWILAESEVAGNSAVKH